VHFYVFEKNITTFETTKPQPLKKRLLVTSLVILVLAGKISAQDSSSFSVSGYVDAYAAIYQDSLAPGDYQKFLLSLRAVISSD